MTTRRRPPSKPWVQLAIRAPEVGNGNGLDAVLGVGARVVANEAAPPAAPPAAPSTAHVAGGRRAHAAGDALEAYVAGLLGSAQFGRVILHWHQIATPTKWVRVETRHDGWQWYREELADAFADFEAFDRAGRVVVIECKSTEGNLLRRDAVEPQQAAHLDAGGDRSLLMVEFRDAPPARRLPRQYCVPWRRVPWRVARTAESIDESSILPWSVPNGAVFFDRLRGR